VRRSCGSRMLFARVVARQLHLVTHGRCWGPSASEGPQKHDLTMFLEYNV
jgi:hypothetical protein